MGVRRRLAHRTLKRLLKMMRRQMTNALYIALMVAVIVATDFLFFKNHFWERLMVNIGIVLVFLAFFFRFLKPP